MAAAQDGEQVYATLLLSDSYLPGALVLAHSLRDAGTSKKLVILVTLDTVSGDSITQLKAVYDQVIAVPRIRNDHPANLYLMNRGDLHSAFTKINLWRQLQFSKIVYIDADIVAYRAPDELFDIQHAFSAAPDIGWPDLFNSGVMVLTPNMADYHTMVAMAEKGISFDGADQGLLNMHFRNDYNRLSFTYNVTPSAHYQYVPAYRHLRSTINMVHFIGSNKPWFAGRGSQGDSPYDDMVGRWWAVYDRHYGAQRSTDNTTQPNPKYVQYFTKGEWQPSVAAGPTASGEHDQGRHDPGSSADVVNPPSSQSPPSAPGRIVSASGHGQSPAAGVSAAHDSRAFPSSSDSASHATGTHAEVRSEPHRSGQQDEGNQAAPPPPPAEEPKQQQDPQQVGSHSWDAQWHPPPVDSKPEAINFPKTHYEMSRDAAPFVPPARYPSPPKNMWYEVPKEPPTPTRPRAIFPWEHNQPRASRTFAGEPEPSVDTRDFAPPDTAAEAKNEPPTPSTPTIKITSSDPWNSFTRLNAWDDVPEIGRYVEGLQKNRRGKSQGSGGVSPVGVRPTTPTGSGRRAKHGTFKLTDFPSEVERPSLPVTPAPIHRRSYWGEEAVKPGDEKPGEQLPVAEGVPAQSEWDPVAQLQKLAKQQSDMLLRKLGGEEGTDPSREIPTRPLPFGSDDVKSSHTFVPGTAHGFSASASSRGIVHSPRPVKGEATTSLVRNIGGVQSSETAGGNLPPVPGTAAAPTLGESLIPRRRQF
ncbi:hypothetical protein NLU13_1603 [Sarocladium strictum]|uniref:glycogenin glucosyltransferase n=1 Tax=Sarocladium strictum TaxID=5046 RepID=A0AA39LCI7_SARSR|nr:hypothetical protein NLU13_1603 [Sarocladium strictum]